MIISTSLGFQRLRLRPRWYATQSAERSTEVMDVDVVFPLTWVIWISLLIQQCAFYAGESLGAGHACKVAKFFPPRYL